MIVECFGVPGSGKSMLVTQLLEMGFETVPDYPPRLYALLFITKHPWSVLRWVGTLVTESVRSRTLSLLRFKLAVFLTTLSRLAYAHTRPSTALVVLDEGLLQRSLTLFETEKSARFCEQWVRNLPLCDVVISIPPGSQDAMRVGTRRKQLGSAYAARWLPLVRSNYRSLASALAVSPIQRFEYQTERHPESLHELFKKLKEYRTTRYAATAS